MKKRISMLALVFLLTGCISIPTGDGGKVKLSKDGLEFEDRDGEKTSVSVDTDEGGYSMDFGDGTSTKLGTNAEIPDAFPKDILLPKNGDLILSSEMNDDEDTTYSISYTVEGDLTKDAEAYKTYLTDNGYEIQEYILGGEVIAYQGTKTTNYLHYQLMGDSDSAEYSIIITYGLLDTE